MEPGTVLWEYPRMAPVKKPKPELQRTYLKEWREARKMTQEAAAAQLDVSRALLSKIENAKSPYSQPLLEKAAKAYRCETVELLVRDPRDNGDAWALLSRLRKADPPLRNMILGVVDRMLQRT